MVDNGRRGTRDVLNDKQACPKDAFAPLQTAGVRVKRVVLDPRLAALYACLDRIVETYPEHAVQRMHAFALGTAFFPAGAGLVPANRMLPAEPVMIVAHVFDAPSFTYALGPGGGNERIDANRTWLGLRVLLERAGLAIERCFLTNALVGVKVGSACGHVAGGAAYRRACERFMLEQVLAIRPVTIVTLGGPAMRVLGAASPDLLRRWTGCNTLAALDRADPPAHTVREARFGTHLVRSVVALQHTCSWAGTRVYRGARGARADALLLRDALDVRAEAHQRG